MGTKSELLHDGCPVACLGDAPFGYVNVFHSHVNVGFFHGAALPDSAHLLQGTGKFMRHQQTAPTPGVGSVFYSIADRLCSRKSMHSIILPAIADLRLASSQALAEGRPGKAIAICMRGRWHLIATLALAIWHGRA